MQSNATDFIKRFTVEELEIELEALRRNAEEKQQARDRASEEYGQAASELHLCEQLLSLRQAYEEEAASGVDASSLLGDAMDQTSAVLSLIRAGGKRGIRPKEIARALEGSGIAVKPAYLHTILTRLKKRRDVRSERGAYFPE